MTAINNIEAAALQMAREGLQIFPCGGNKQPLTENGFKDATSDETVIRAWWKRWPTANIGLPTGKKNNLVVFDLDKDEAKGIDGEAALQVVIDREGVTLPTTRLIRTPKGLHAYFRHPGQTVKNSTSKIGPGLDIRAEGGYVIAPPSRNGNGKEYKVVIPEPIADLPPALVKLIVEPARHPAPIPAQSFNDTPDRAKIEDALRCISANCPFDDWLRTGMALHSWNPSEGRALWDSWSRTAPERYQEAAIGQHWKTFKLGAVTVATLFKQAIDAGWKPARKATERPPTKAAPPHAQPPTGALAGIDARIWLATEPPAPDQILCDAFDAGDKVSVIGSSKMRKSFFVLQASNAIAAGRDFLTWKITKARRVLLAQFEIKADHFWRRVRNMARAMGISADDIGDRLLIFNCRGITGETAIERIGAEAQKHRAEVIIFDPLYKLTEGDENAAKDMKPTLAAFDRLAEATGAAVIYVHHDAKGHAGDRDSRDRGAGSNVGRRDDDFCITITAHDTEESSVVIDCLWRNYKPRDPFTATWTERGCFEYMPDLPAVKKTSRSRSATTTARPELETYQDTAMNLIARKPLAISLFREKIEAMAGMTQARQKCLVEMLLADGKLVEHHQRERGCHKAWIGTPEQIEEMRQIRLKV